MNRVLTHDSYRAAEKPVAVIFEEQRFDVVEILDSWIAAGIDPKEPIRRGFVVRCAGGARFKLVHSDPVGWEITPIPGPRLVSSDEGNR